MEEQQKEITLKDYVLHLARCRNAEAVIQEEIADLQAVVEKTPAWRMLEAAKNKLKLHKEFTTNAEAILKEMAILHFNHTQEKKPVPGVEIKIFHRYIYQEADAIHWAMEAKQIKMVSLNKSVFEKALPGLSLDFVKAEEEPKAYISKELEIEEKENKGNGEQIRPV